MKTLDKLEVFFFRYFSESTIDTKDWWVRYVFGGVMLIPMGLGFVFTVLDKYIPAKICTLTFTGMLVVFSALWITVWFYHRHKIKKNE